MAKSTKTTTKKRTGPEGGEPRPIDRPTDRCDPYLVWAEITKFRGIADVWKSSKAVCPESRVEVVGSCFSATAPKDIGDVRHLIASVQRKGGNREYFFTSTLTISRLRKLVRSRTGYEVELSAPRQVTFDKDPLPFTRLEQKQRPARIGGNVLAIIDDGLGFLHEEFRTRDNKTRVAWLWDQTIARTPREGGDDARAGSPLWQPVHGQTYGRELDRAAIDSLVQCATSAAKEADLYRLLDFPEAASELTHGTHVASLAAGRTVPRDGGKGTRDLAGDDATQLIMVQLPHKALLDTSGGATPMFALDAVMYILDRVTPDANVVINLSLGTTAGPADGSTLFERVLDAVLQREERKGRNIALVLPAGNAFNAQCHAALTLTRARPVQTLQWHVMADDQTDSFVELWYSRDFADEISISLYDPTGRKVCADVGLGQLKTDKAERRNKIPAVAVIHTRKSIAGDWDARALIALAPTLEQAPGMDTVPYGIWRIEVTRTAAAASKEECTVNAWVQRDDAVIGGPTSSRQSRFVSTRGPLADDDEDVPDDPVKRMATGNAISYGVRSIVVGGCVGLDGSLAKYTAAGHGKHVGRRAAPWPDVLAVSDEATSLPGVAGAGTYSGSRVRMDGTSVAAPQVARNLLNLFAADPKKKWNIVELRKALGAAAGQGVAPPEDPRPVSAIARARGG